jgi:hypothetical protein
MVRHQQLLLITTALRSNTQGTRCFEPAAPQIGVHNYRQTCGHTGRCIKATEKLDDGLGVQALPGVLRHHYVHERVVEHLQDVKP